MYEDELSLPKSFKHLHVSLFTVKEVCDINCDKRLVKFRSEEFHLFGPNSVMNMCKKF